MNDFKTTLISSINEVTEYGLQPNLNVLNRDLLLEKYLISIYKLYFEIEYLSDPNNYPDFDKSKLPDIRKNIISNFAGFGYYKTVIDINDMTNYTDIGLGDAMMT